MEADVYFFQRKTFKDLAELVNLSEILICSDVLFLIRMMINLKNLQKMKTFW